MKKQVVILMMGFAFSGLTSVALYGQEEKFKEPEPAQVQEAPKPVYQPRHTFHSEGSPGVLWLTKGNLSSFELTGRWAAGYDYSFSPVVHLSVGYVGVYGSGTTNKSEVIDEKQVDYKETLKINMNGFFAGLLFTNQGDHKFEGGIVFDVLFGEWKKTDTKPKSLESIIANVFATALGGGTDKSFVVAPRINLGYRYAPSSSSGIMFRGGIAASVFLVEEPVVMPSVYVGVGFTL